MSDPGKVTVTKEKWEAMSAEEKALCRSLGIGVAKDEKREAFQRKEAHRSKPLQEYVLGVMTTCELCKEVEVQSYQMKLDQKVGHYYLVGEIETVKLPQRFRTQRVNTCRNCKYKLTTWTKQQLLDRLIRECSLKEANKLIEAKTVLEPTKTVPREWIKIYEENGGESE